MDRGERKDEELGGEVRGVRGPLGENSVPTEHEDELRGVAGANTEDRGMMWIFPRAVELSWPGTEDDGLETEAGEEGVNGLEDSRDEGVNDLEDSEQGVNGTEEDGEEGVSGLEGKAACSEK